MSGWRCKRRKDSVPGQQRHLFTRPGNDKWAVWQVSGFARVDGIEGAVDLNVGKLAIAKV